MAKIGDQVCQKEANTLECCFDLLDCNLNELNHHFDEKFGCLTCELEMPLSSANNSLRNSLGDHFCDKALFTPKCCMDGGDCLLTVASKVCSTCSVVKSNQKIGDGICQPFLLTSMCCYDAGDCLLKSHCITCSLTDKYYDMHIGNQICEEQYNTPECCFDGGDCSVDICPSTTCCTTSNCNSYLANDVCDFGFNTIECCFDGGSCLVEICPTCLSPVLMSQINDGLCDKTTSAHKECCFDGTDCNSDILLDTMIGGCPGCSIENAIHFLADGKCNGFMNKIACCFDGGDCELLAALDCSHCHNVIQNSLHLGDFVCDFHKAKSEPCCLDGQDCRPIYSRSHFCAKTCPYNDVTSMSNLSIVGRLFGITDIMSNQCLAVCHTGTDKL